MAAAPALLLILGSITLAAWRRMGRRAGRGAEGAIAGLALLAGLLLGRSIPVRSSYPLWPPTLSFSASVDLALTPWTWAILVCVLAIGLFHALTAASGETPPRPTAPSAALVFIAAISLATVAASTLTLLLTWTFVIGAQAWLVRTQSAVDEPALLWRNIKGRDFATVLLLIGSFGFTSPGDATGWFASALLALAAGTRIWSSISATNLGDGGVARLGFPATASVLGGLAWAWGAERGATPSSWVAAGGLVLVLAGWLSSWLAETEDHRARGWIVGIGGLALIASAASPGQIEKSLSTAAALLILAGALGIGLSLGKIGSRISAAVAAMMTIGVPGLVGAVFLGAAVPAGSVSVLGWAAVAGAGLLASVFLGDILRARAVADPSSSSSPSAFVAAAVMAVLGLTLYLRLRGLVPPPASAAAPAALAMAIIVSLLWGRVPEDRRMRVARAMRWPAAVRPPRGTVVGPAETLVRGVRDVLEGDAALLWALVVVVVGLLLLQGAT